MEDRPRLSARNEHRRNHLLQRQPHQTCHGGQLSAAGRQRRLHARNHRQFHGHARHPLGIRIPDRRCRRRRRIPGFHLPRRYRIRYQLRSASHQDRSDPRRCQRKGQGPYRHALQERPLGTRFQRTHPRRSEGALGHSRRRFRMGRRERIRLGGGPRGHRGGRTHEGCGPDRCRREIT